MKNLWRSDKYISILGYRFYYKKFFLYRIARPLGLKCWRKWKNKRNQKKHKLRTRNAPAKRERVKSKICFVCRKKFQIGDKITLEHIKPKSKLKHRHLYDHPSNHALSHYHCNQKKADKLSV
jgi:hypothetical protein